MLFMPNSDPTISLCSRNRDSLHQAMFFHIFYCPVSCSSHQFPVIKLTWLTPGVVLAAGGSTCCPFRYAFLYILIVTIWVTLSFLSAQNSLPILLWLDVLRGSWTGVPNEVAGEPTSFSTCKHYIIHWTKEWVKTSREVWAEKSIITTAESKQIWLE